MNFEHPWRKPFFERLVISGIQIVPGPVSAAFPYMKSPMRTLFLHLREERLDDFPGQPVLSGYSM